MPCLLRENTLGHPFKLEAVLNHRRHCEDTARKRYADAVREWRQQQTQLTEMQAARQECRLALRRKQSSGETATEILMYTRYLTRLDTEIQAQEKVVCACMQAKEKQRQSLMVALKNRKVIEKLKEHHVNRLASEERGREQKLLNDVAIARYQRAGKKI